MTHGNDEKPQSAMGSASFANAAYRRYARELHRYLLRRLHRPQDVDDLAQEVYARLIRLGNGKCVRNPLAYIYGIASHVVADFRITQENEQDRVTFDSEMAAERAEHLSFLVPDELADTLNISRQLERALTRLPPTHAAVLLAHKRDGLSYQEVAQKLKLSVHTVEKYVTQAKAQIRAMSWDR